MVLPLIKSYRRHRCSARHRTVRSWLRCAFPRTEWVSGDGDIALFAWCPPLTVSLHGAIAAAVEQQSILDATGCGHNCAGRHEVVRLDWDVPA